MCQFRCHLTFCKTLYQMVSFHTAHLMESLFCCHHICIRIFIGTSDGIFEDRLFRLCPVHGIIDGSLQRVRFLCGFFFVFHIFNGTVQAVDGDNTCISHPALPLFLYQMPCFFGKPQHFLNALLACHSRSIGNMGKLVRIIAQTRYLPKQFRVMLTGFCVYLCS